VPCLTNGFFHHQLRSDPQRVSTDYINREQEQQAGAGRIQPQILTDKHKSEQS